MAVERKNKIDVKKLNLILADDGSYNGLESNATTETDEITIDLKNYFTSLTISSSIKDIIVSGSIEVSDIDDVISGYRIKGRSLLEIELIDKNKDYHLRKYFYVYAIDNINSKEEVKTYSIKFTSIMTVFNEDIRIGKRLNGTLVDIVKEVYNLIKSSEERITGGNDNSIRYTYFLNGNNTVDAIFTYKFDFNTTNLEPTYKHSFVCPMWKPLRLLDYIVSHSLSNVGGSNGYRFCDCLFYEQLYTGDIKTTFIFKSIADTYTQNFTGGTSYGNNTNVLTFKQLAKNISPNEENYYSIDNFDFSEYYDVINDKKTGLYGFCDTSVDMVHDLSTNIFTGTTYNVNEMNFSNIKEELSHYAYYSGITEMSSNLEFKYTTNPVYMLGIDGIDCSLVENPAKYDCVTLPYQRSLALRNYFDYYKITLYMDKCHINLRLGEYVLIDVREKKVNKNNFTKSTTALKSESFEEYFKGVKWVIDGFTHTIRNDGTCDTLVTLHTIFLNRKTTEKTKISSHVDTVRSEMEYDANINGGSGISTSSSGTVNVNASSTSTTDNDKINRYIAVMRASVPAEYSNDKRMMEGYYDCSSFVCRCLSKAGFNIKEDLTTANIDGGLTGCGFTRISYSKGQAKLVGDILWRSGHVITYIGNNQEIGAHTSKRKNGVCIQTFYEDNYQYIYRLSNGYTGTNTTNGLTQTITGESVNFTNNPKNLRSSLTANLYPWQRNKNPGNIKESGGKSYRKFNTYSEGICAWYNLMKTSDKYFKNSKTKIFIDILKVYAPESDGNDHTYYVSVTRFAEIYRDTKILRTDKNKMADLARGMFAAETSHRFTRQEILTCWEKGGIQFFTD